MGICHGFYGKCLIAGAAHTSTAVCFHVTDYLKYITDNCTCCWKFSCSTSVEHGITYSISMYKYRIVGIIDRCKRMLCRDQHRAYISLNTVLLAAGNTQKFDLTAHFLGVADIFRCDLGDSLDMNIVKSNSGIKSNGGKDRYLSSCVNSFYICSRICLCISKLCGKSKGI